MARILAALTVFALYLQAQQQLPALLAIQDNLEAGNLDEAAQLIEQSFANHPNDGGLLNLRGVLHARRNQLPEARADFAQAVQQSPQLTPAWQNLARACQQLNETDCSIGAWQHVLHSKPADAEAQSSLAQLYAIQERFAESLRHLNQANRDNLELRCLDLSGLGRIPEATAAATRLAQQNDFSEADFAGMHGPLDNPKAASVVVALAEGLDKRSATNWPTLQRLALAYEHLQRPAEARKTLERVALSDPQNTAHLLELARLAEESKDHEGALGYLAHARDLTPNVARIHFLFGVIAGELNLPIEARQSLDKALALDPDNPEYNYAMGSVILTTRDAASAATYFAKFVKAHPTDGRGHFALGLAHFASGDYELAKQEMRIARNNKDAGPAAEYYLGRMARLEGDLDEAARCQQEALSLRPQWEEPHTELARIALLKGDTGQAHAELDRALRYAPQSFQANEQLLVLYKRTHDPRAVAQEIYLKKLDDERSKRADLMLRTLEMRP